MLAEVQRITSRRNAIVERYRAAARGEGGLLLDGARLVGEALTARVTFVSALVAAEALHLADVHVLVGRLQDRNVDTFAVTSAVLEAASPVRSPATIVALAEPRQVPREAPYETSAARVLVACDVQDPGNVGAMARVCEAAGASGLVAAGRSADPFGWKALRGSMGSALRLPVVRQRTVTEALQQARRHGCRVVAAIPRAGTVLFDADLSPPCAIFVGGEGAGLPGDLVDTADERVTVPMCPPVESLNAAVTAALLLYEAERRQS